MDSPTEDPPKAPTALKLVALLFLIEGIVATTRVILHAANLSLHLDLGVIGLWIGIGLRFRSRLCWLLGRAYLWIGMIVVPVFTVMLLNGERRDWMRLWIVGIPVAQISRGLVVIFCIASFLLSLWMYRVLCRRDVRVLFAS